MKTLEQKLRGLTPARRRKIENRVTALIDEEKSLQDLRRALSRRGAHIVC